MNALAVVSPEVGWAAPAWLALLPVVLAICVLDALRPWAGTGPGRRVTAAAVRTLVLAGLVVAIAEPRWHRHASIAHVVFVVDRSASMSDAALAEAVRRTEAVRASLPADTRVGLVVFDDHPEVAVVPGQPFAWPEPLRHESIEATDIDAALALAFGIIPAADAGEVVLVTDGRSTVAASPDARSGAAPDPRPRGLPVHTIAIDGTESDPRIGSLELASHEVRPGSAIEGRVVVEGSDAPVRGTVVVEVGRERVLLQEVEIPARQTIELRFDHALDPRTDPGPLPVRADFVPRTEDHDPANDHAETTVLVGQPPRVRIFAGEAHDGNALARALRAERMQVQVVPMDALDPGHEALDDIDLVVLANAPATAIAGGRALRPAFQEKLARFVDRGGGLVVIGGPQAFDMGGYAGSRLDRILPVKLEPMDSEVQAGATMIIILDRSGSMSTVVGFSKTKMALADEGAAASIGMLRPFDQVGVMSVTEEVRWEIPIQPVRDPEPLKRKVMRVVADGGGIFVYTALDAAERALSGVRTPLKHVILFSDAADSEEQVKGIPFGTGPGPTAQELTARMRRSGITTSVIGIGTRDDTDTAFLQELARAGGGRFYLTDDATRLRALFVEETERLVDSSMHEIGFRPQKVREHAIVTGIDYARGPELRGYQELDARPTAEVILRGPDGHPLLVTWRYGLGQVVAWASDAGPRWAESWLVWHGYSRQWTQAARFALKSTAGHDTAIEVDDAAGQARLRIARRGSDGLSIDEGRLRVRITSGDERFEATLRSLEPGLWESTVPTTAGRTYQVEVLASDGDTVLASQGFTQPPSLERRHREADREGLRVLAEQTGGLVEPRRLAPERRMTGTTDVVHLWPWALLFATLLLPLDAFLRRPARTGL